MTDELRNQFFVRFQQKFSLTPARYMQAEYRLDDCHCIFEITVARISMEISFFPNVPDAYFITDSIPPKAIDPRFLLFRSACKPLQ